MNSVNSTSTQGGAMRFKFRGFWWLLIMQCGMLLAFASLFVPTLRQDTPYWLYAFLVSAISLLLFTIYATLNGAMDILFDATGISRCIGGKVVKHMHWRDVRLIRVFDLYSWKEHKKTIGMHILSGNKAHPSSTSGGKIVICENPMRQGTFSELIAVMNTYITEHQISIESTVGGETTHPDNLSYVPRRPNYDPIDWYNR
jgi:hypothetical protein